MKKKRISVVIMVVLTMLLTGCGQKNSSAQGEDTTVKEQKPDTLGDQSVKVGDNVISLGDEMSDVTDKLGEAQDVTEAKSCMYDGYDRTYSYDDLTIITNEEGEKEIVNSISFSGGEEIKCGLHVGDAASDIPESLNEGNVTESDTVNTYEFSDYGIALYLENQKISQIELYTISE